MADMASLSSLLDKNAVLFASYELWANANVALVSGTIDDPDSFNVNGGKTGALGYYPVTNVNGQTVYVPCLARLMAISQGNLDPAVLEAALSASVNATNAAAASSALKAGESAASATQSQNSATVSTNQAAISTGQAGIATTQAGIATAKAAQADADAIATAADRVQTGSDRAQTGADAGATGADRAQTSADRVQTGADRAAVTALRADTQVAADQAASAQAELYASQTVGEPTVAVGPNGPGSDSTWLFDAPVISDGWIRSIRIANHTNPATAPTSFKVKRFTKSGTTFTPVVGGETVITGLALGNQTKAVNLPVKAGEYLAVYTGANGLTYENPTTGAALYRNAAGDVTTPTVFSGASAGTLRLEIGFDITYLKVSNSRIAALETAVARINYPPITATMSVAPSQAEVGSTVASVAVSWNVANQTPTSQTLEGSGVASTDRAATLGPYSANKTFALAVTDANAPGGAQVANASATLTFLPRFYAGVFDGTAPTDAQLRALATSGFATARGRSVTFNASAGGYPFYAWPASLGAISSVTVGGLAFTDYTVTTRDVVNASGATVSMNILRFNNRQTGAAIGVTFA